MRTMTIRQRKRVPLRQVNCHIDGLSQDTGHPEILLRRHTTNRKATIPIHKSMERKATTRSREATSTEATIRIRNMIARGQGATILNRETTALDSHRTLKSTRWWKSNISTSVPQPKVVANLDSNHITLNSLTMYRPRIHSTSSGTTRLCSFRSYDTLLPCSHHLFTIWSDLRCACPRTTKNVRLRLSPFTVSMSTRLDHPLNARDNSILVKQQHRRRSNGTNRPDLRLSDRNLVAVARERSMSNGSLRLTTIRQASSPTLSSTIRKPPVALSPVTLVHAAKPKTIRTGDPDSKHESIVKETVAAYPPTSHHAQASASRRQEKAARVLTDTVPNVVRQSISMQDHLEVKVN